MTYPMLLNHGDPKWLIWASLVMFAVVWGLGFYCIRRAIYYRKLAHACWPDYPLSFGVLLDHADEFVYPGIIGIVLGGGFFLILGVNVP